MSHDRKNAGWPNSNRPDTVCGHGMAYSQKPTRLSFRDARTSAEDDTHTAMITLDIKSGDLTFGAQVIKLRKQGLVAMQILAERFPETVSRKEVAEHLKNKKATRNPYPEEGVSSIISFIRQLVGTHGRAFIVNGEGGEGYRLALPVTIIGEADEIFTGPDDSRATLQS